jgi:hypothetical protein
MWANLPLRRQPLAATYWLPVTGCFSAPGKDRNLFNKKNLGIFAKLSPSNSFRINKSTPQASLNGVNSRRIHGS